MITKFVEVFKQEPDKFEKYSAQEKMEILFAILEDATLLNYVIEEIKENEMDGNGNIFVNVLSLMPFSAKIVEKFLESKFLEDESAYKKLKVVLKTRNKIFNILQDYKKMLRNEKLRSVDLDAKINEIDRELRKYSEIIRKKEKYKRKIKELKKVKNLKTGDIEILKREYEELQKRVQEIEKLKQEIEKSKEIFKNLPKDES